MSRIFISYRREDTGPYAGRLFDDLKNHIRRDELVMDIESIGAGENFVEFIQDEIHKCDIVIVLIGRRWLSIRQGGQRRLDDPLDFVRLEVGAALARDVDVIPVLVQGASMPPSARLPDDMKALSNRQAFELSDRRWRYDVEQLARRVRQLSHSRWPRWRQVVIGPRGALAVGLLAIAVAVGWYVVAPDTSNTPTQATAVVGVAPSPVQPSATVPVGSPTEATAPTSSALPGGVVSSAVSPVPPSPSPPLVLSRLRVIADSVNLRAFPGASAPVIKFLMLGAIVEVIGPDTVVDGYVWSNVRDHDGITGWIAANFLGPEPLP